MPSLDEVAPPLRGSLAGPAPPLRTPAFNPLESIPPRPAPVKGKRGEWVWNPYGNSTEGRVYTHTGRVCTCGNILMADANFCRKCGSSWTPRGTAQASEPLASAAAPREQVATEPVAVYREPVRSEPVALAQSPSFSVPPRMSPVFQAEARPVQAPPYRAASPPSRPLTPAPVLGRMASPTPRRAVSPAEYRPAPVFAHQTATAVYAAAPRVDPLPPKVQPIVYQTPPTTVEKQMYVEQMVKEVPVHIPHPVYVDKLVDRPVYIEKIVEKVVDRPVYIDKVVERPVFVDKVVERPVFIDNFVEVERIVEVPQVRVQQVFVDKPVDRLVYVDKVVERVVDRPYPVERIVDREVHVPVPHAVYIDKPVDRPVYVDKMVEVEKIVNVPQVQYQQVFVDKPVDRPVFVDRVVERVVDRPYAVETIVDREVQVPVPQPVYIDQFVDRPVYIDKIVEREKIVNVPQVQRQQVVVEKIVDRPVYIDKVIDRIVERPVERIVEKQVPVPQTVYVDKYIDRPQIVERVVEHERVVHVPQLQQVFVEKTVDRPVYVDRVIDRVVEQPIERLVETRVEIPQIHTVEKIVDRPVYVDRVVDRVVEKPIHHVPLTYAVPPGMSSASTQLPSPELTPPGTAWPGSSVAILPSWQQPFHAMPTQPVPMSPPMPNSSWVQPLPMSARWEPPSPRWEPAAPPDTRSRGAPRTIGDIGAWGSGFGSGTLPSSAETVWAPPPPMRQPGSTPRGMDTTTVPMLTFSQDAMPYASYPEEPHELHAGDDFPYHDPFEGCDFEGRNVEWSSGNFWR